MSFSQNRISLIGNLTEKSELRQTPNGANVIDLNIKVKNIFEREDGIMQASTSFHNVVLWNRQAEVADQYLSVGGQVYLAGRLKTEEWEAEDGQKKRKTKMIAHEIILLDSKYNLPELGEVSPIAGGLNQTEIIGNLTRDPELRQTPNGNNVCNFSIATNRRWRDKTTQEINEETEFHNVVAWNELADVATENLKKGQRVFLAGRCMTRSWETPDGEKKWTTEVIAEKLILLGYFDNTLATGNNQETEKSATQATEQKAKSGAQPEATETIEDDLPEIPEIKHESKIKPEDLPF